MNNAADCSSDQTCELLARLIEEAPKLSCFTMNGQHGERKISIEVEMAEE